MVFHLHLADFAKDAIRSYSRGNLLQLASSMRTVSPCAVKHLHVSALEMEYELGVFS